MISMPTAYFWFEISKALLNEYVHRMTPPSPRPTATVTPWNHHNDLAMNTFNPSVTLIRFSEILAFAISRPWTENHHICMDRWKVLSGWDTGGLRPKAAFSPLLIKSWCRQSLEAYKNRQDPTPKRRKNQKLSEWVSQKYMENSLNENDLGHVLINCRAVFLWTFSTYGVRRIICIN